jgi:hypothetical protein
MNLCSFVRELRMSCSAKSMNEPEHEDYAVGLGPLFTSGVLLLVYGLLRRRGLAIAAGLGAIWLDQRSEFGRALTKRIIRSAMEKEQVKAHAHSAPDATRGAEPADDVVPRAEWGVPGRPQ